MERILLLGVRAGRVVRHPVGPLESLRVTFPAACGVACSRQRARRLAHHHTRTAHRLLSKYPAPWGGDPLLVKVFVPGPSKVTAPPPGPTWRVPTVSARAVPGTRASIASRPARAAIRVVRIVVV